MMLEVAQRIEDEWDIDVPTGMASKNIEESDEGV